MSLTDTNFHGGKSKKLYEYEYKNREQGLTKLWLAWPDDKKVKEAQVTRPPNLLSSSLDQRIAYYELKEGEEIRLSFKSGAYNPEDSSNTMTNETRIFYLRSTVLSPISEEIRGLALEITTGAKGARDKAELLFHYLVDNYQYVYPPRVRGATAFLKEKKGDCGEYSFLYTALCRALNIPCRTIVGSWAVGKMQAHVWNEVYIEETGWIPVDCSMAYIQKKKKLQFLFSDVRTLPWKKYFGTTEGQRIVFSTDGEIPLEPIYIDVEINKASNRNSFFNIEGKPFHWGYEAINGAAPYMQPAYIRFDEKNLQGDSKIDNRSYLGEWKVKETGFRRVTFLLKRLSVFLAGFCFILGLLIDNPILDITTSVALVLVAVSFTLRGERPLLFGVLTVFLLLSFMSVLNGG